MPDHLRPWGCVMRLVYKAGRAAREVLVLMVLVPAAVAAVLVGGIMELLGPPCRGLWGWLRNV